MRVNLRGGNTKTLCSVKKCKKLLYYKYLILQNERAVQLLPIYDDKIETKTETFYKNSIITFLSPVHIVPWSQVRFKLGAGARTQN